MDWQTTESPPGNSLLAETIAVWQPLARYRLGPDDTRQIVQNVTGFFRLLAEWDSRSGVTLPVADGTKTIVYSTEPAA